VASAAGLSDPSALTKHDGPLTVVEDGAVIENLEIHGTLQIQANDVIVRNVWVYGSDFWTVRVKSGSARFENVEIGNAKYLGLRGIGGSNIVAVGLDIHHVEDGIKLGSNATYSGVNIHDLASPRSDPHTDAVQVESAATNSVVKNSILSSIGSRGVGNASAMIKSSLGRPSNISFVNNYMNGGNFTIFVHDGGHGFPQGVSFIGNRFGTNSRYGLTWFQGPVEWEDNTWEDTGELIDPDGNVIGQGATTTTTVAPTTTSTTTTTVAPTTTSTTNTADQDLPAPPSASNAIFVVGVVIAVTVILLVASRRRGR